MEDLRKPLKSRRGSVMMETVIVMPILLFLVFLLVQFAQIWTAKQMVSYAAFCATRAIVVTHPDEQPNAALNAARMALAWICPADRLEDESLRVTVPGWGEIPGSAGLNKTWSQDGRIGRVMVEIVQDGQDDASPIAAVKVTFRFPLTISAMAVNRVLGSFATDRNRNAAYVYHQDGEHDYYRNLDDIAAKATANDELPYVELSETCVLPMPYSTVKFPKGAFARSSLH